MSALKHQVPTHLLEALGSTKVCIWRWSASTGRIDFFPENADEVVGLSLEKLPRSDEEVLALMHPEDRDRAAEVYQQATQESSGFDIEYRLIGLHQSISYIHETSQPEFDQAGKFVGNFGTWQNITERRLEEDKLHESERRLRTATKTAKLGYFEWDLVEDRCVFCSEEYARLHGMSVEEYMSSVTTMESDSQLVHPDDRARFAAALKESIEGRKSFELEYRILGADGQVRYVRERESYFEEKDGVTRSEGTLLDITDITTTKNKLREYMRKLEISNRELQDFASVASHDLQEPLRKIEAFGGRLSEKYADDLPDEAQVYIDRMQNAASRMRSLINVLLEYSRITTKSKPFERVDLNDVLEGVISDLQIRIEETDADILVGNLPTIDADQMQMRQLFQNLISNALKFAKLGRKPVVRIQGEFVSKEKSSQSLGTDLCRLTFTDNGIGFDNEHRDQIFVIFQRLHGRAEYEGTGIGLATCRKIVDRHGGSIEADGRPDEGATFTVTIPSA